MISLHLLKISLVSINTLMMRHVLAERVWLDHMASDDCGLSPRASPSIAPPMGRSSDFAAADSFVRTGPLRGRWHTGMCWRMYDERRRFFTRIPLGYRSMWSVPSMERSLLLDPLGGAK